MEKKMKKTLRVTTEIRFINNREQFTLQDLMTEFSISRSTAIRDIAEIQELGLPLTSTPGHNGGYSVLRNQTLPAVTFTPTEIQALFVAFLATTNQQLPYLKNRQAITEKLLTIVPDNLQNELLNLQDLLWFDNTNPDNPSIVELSDQAPAMLSDLISQSVKKRTFKINYQKRNANGPEWHEIYVEHFYNSNSHWYMSSYDFTRNDERTFRVDRVQEIQDSPLHDPIIIHDQIEKRHQPTPNVILELGPMAIERFKRIHQPGKQLQFTDPFQQHAIFKDYIGDNSDGIQMFVDWLLFLGDDVEVREMTDNVRDALKLKVERWG
ncbi:hypothetical protein FD16_GL000703 [Paucilactobacillus suebicus DSM 5007 = KCTC 3549]|uniref:HTH deoR-type domain-containing protein n=2 Tax=Paucilactobacillus suebicus TaxID=152335 RepID=A0A0R1W1C3_9LACO|nr:hypothetical protein FD16_GL000703 [Paucilactobacillus suebicus DSM 5007 = KCTC 3549]